MLGEGFTPEDEEDSATATVTATWVYQARYRVPLAKAAAGARGGACLWVPAYLGCPLGCLQALMPPACCLAACACCVLGCVHSVWHLQRCRLVLCCMGGQVPQAAASTTGDACCLRRPTRCLQARIPLACCRTCCGLTDLGAGVHGKG